MVWPSMLLSDGQLLRVLRSDTRLRRGWRRGGVEANGTDKVTSMSAPLQIKPNS